MPYLDHLIGQLKNKVMSWSIWSELPNPLTRHNDDEAIQALSKVVKSEKEHQLVCKEVALVEIIPPTGSKKNGMQLS